MWQHVVRAFAAVFIVLVSLNPAAAHFSQGAKLRTIILAGDESGLTAYVRTPAPLVFSDVVRQAQAIQTPLETPFLYLENTAAGPRYRIDLQAIATDESGFAQRLEAALSFTQNGHAVPTALVAYRIVGRAPSDPFATPAEAQAAISGQSTGLDPVFGDAVIEMELALDAPVLGGALEVRSALPELPLIEGVSIDNHIADARGDTPVSYTIPGQLTEGATLDGSLWRTVAAFVWQGVLHIVEGIDHVFLVICLALGFGGSFWRLVGLVTAFTLGHSITLVATFLGTAPTWPWFVPAVEAAIAASVVYAAAAAVMKKMGSVWIIGAIGLLHGLGFSFVLGDILGRESPNLIPALAAFNIGIELGQVAILSVTLLTVFILERLSLRLVLPARTATLGVIGVVAAWWVVERTMALV